MSSVFIPRWPSGMRTPHWCSSKKNSAPMRLYDASMTLKLFRLPWRVGFALHLTNGLLFCMEISLTSHTCSPSLTRCVKPYLIFVSHVFRFFFKFSFLQLHSHFLLFFPHYLVAADACFFCSKCPGADDCSAENWRPSQPQQAAATFGTTGQYWSQSW